MKGKRNGVGAWIILIIALPFFMFLPENIRGDESLTPGRHTITLKADGYERQFHVQVPACYDPRTSIPVVLIFHGAGGGGDLYLDKNGWAAKAEKECFAAVAPDGLPARPNRPAQFLLNPRLWNDGQLLSGSLRSKIDDTAFIRALLDDLGRRLNIDARRIYMTGHSNGAGMIFRLGAELSERFAAMAPAAGHCWIQDPKPAKRMPTLYIVGTKDPLIRPEGGEIQLPWGKKTQPPVVQTLSRWAKALGLTTPASVVRDKDGLKIMRYGDENGSSSLTAWFIEGQGHGWPGGSESGLPALLIGPAVGTVKATDVIWDFFKKY